MDNSEVYIIKLKDQNFTSGMQKAGQETDKVHNKVNAVNSAMGMVGGIVAGIGVVTLGQQIIQTLAKFEKFEAVLTTTLGSGSQAQAAMAQITEFAAKTPFEVDGLTDSFVRLANQGFVPTMAEMTKLGDVASSKGKDMTQLAEALIDAQVGEFERLKEFGIRASKNGDKVSFTFKGQTKTMKMTDAAVKDYILSLGDLQGVQGSMAGIAETTGGKLSNLSDQVTGLYLKLGTKLKPAISAVTDGLMVVVGWIGDFADWVTSGSTGANIFIGVLATLAGGFLAYQAIMTVLAAKTAIVTAAQWLWNIAMTANPIGIIIVAIGALIGFIGWLAMSTEGWGQAWDHTWKGIKLIFSATMGVLKTDWLMVQNIFLSGIDLIMMAWYKLKSLWNEDEANAGMAQIQKESDQRKKAIKESAVQTAKDFTAGVNEFKAAAGSIKWKKDDAKKDAKDKVTKNATEGLGAGAGGKKKGLDAGISEVRSTAPKNFYITIGKLVEKLDINTTNLTEGSAKVKEEITKALLMAVNDMQIISE